MIFFVTIVYGVHWILYLSTLCLDINIYIYLSVYIHISTTCLYIYIVCTYIYINIHTYVCVYDGTAAAALIWMNGNHTQGKDHVFNPASV